MPSKRKQSRYNLSFNKKKSKKSRSSLFRPLLSRRSLFVLLFAAVGAAVVIISSALTSGFSFSGQVTDKNPTKSFTVTSPAVGTLKANLSWDRTTTLNLKIEDPSGAVVYNQSADKSPISTTVSTTKGSYRIYVSKVGGWNSKFSLTGDITTPDPDSTGPLVSFSAPTNGATVAGGVPVQATASHSSGITKIDFLIDNSVYRSESQSPYCMAGDSGGACFAWDSKTVSDGQHTLSAVAYAGNGQTTRTDITITVANNSTTTPPPTTGGGGSGTLSWAPPANWNNFTTKTVPASGGTISLANDTDYKLVAPEIITGPVTITGGRNIVWIGGVFGGRTTMPSGSYDSTNRGIRLYDGADVARTVHFEGLWFKPGTYLSDAIQIAIRSNNSVRVVVQNVRVDSYTYGTQAGVHADTIQAWGGPTTLLIDSLTAKNVTYQGFYLDPQDGRTLPTGSREAWVTRRVNLEGNSALTGSTSYMLTNRRPDFTNMINDRVYTNGSSKNSTDTYANWPSAGLTQNATPPGGDWVPASLWIGTTYTSPGYQ